VLIVLAIMLFTLVTLLVARFVSFLVLIFLEVPLFKIVPVIAPNISFEFMLSPPGNWLPAGFVTWLAPW
jgi:hypothetical protein